MQGRTAVANWLLRGAGIAITSDSIDDGGNILRPAHLPIAAVEPLVHHIISVVYIEIPAAQPGVGRLFAANAVGLLRSEGNDGAAILHPVRVAYARGIAEAALEVARRLIVDTRVCVTKIHLHLAGTGDDIANPVAPIPNKAENLIGGGAEAVGDVLPGKVN